MSRFDPETSALARWQPVIPGEVWPLHGDLSPRVLPNAHWTDVPPGQFKCVGYTVQQTKAVLRTELRGLPQATLDRLRMEKGREALMTQQVEDLLTFTGDTPIVDARVWGRPRILVDEATFLDAETALGGSRRNRHSHLAGVLDVALEVAPEGLVLIHFSSRHSVAARRLPFPVWIVPPEEIVRDVFRRAPVWSASS